MRAEQRSGIARPVRGKFLQVVEQFLGDVLEVDHRLDVEYGLCLLGEDMLVNICLESLFECRDILRLHRESGSIGVTAEVGEQVAAALYGLVDVEARH